MPDLAMMTHQDSADENYIAEVLPWTIMRVFSLCVSNQAYPQRGPDSRD